MSGRPSLCPHCREELPEAATTAPARDCPRCGGPVEPRETGEIPAGGPEAARARRPLSTAIVATVAVAAIAAAGVAISQNLPALLPLGDQAAGAPAPASAPAKNAAEKAKEEGPSWSHSRLAVVDAGRRPAIVLGRPSGMTEAGPGKGVQRGLLARELIRQAVLLAARDELGAATRDELLGDAAPDGKESASVDFALLPRLNGPASVKVVRDGAAPQVLLDQDVLPAASIHDLVALAGAAEGLSRTEFPRVLKSLGIEAKPNAYRPDAELPGSVADRLESLGFVEPLAAVRELHAAIRDDGESPARLGALVRGYARLGVLNEHLWTPAHKVFKARALLYAQRLIARDPDSPWGLWHRAYILALAGLHQRALDDLAEADKLARGKDAPKAPAWAGTLKGYCHFDLAGLKQVEGPQARFAALLRMLALEFPSHSDVALHAAREVLSADPDCFRAHDVLYRVGGVANLHVATMFGPQVLARGVPPKILALGSLPKGVREPIERDAGEVALVEALERAGAPGQDAGEPSWAVLGSLIRETRFVHVQHRLYFMRYSWSVPVEEFWNEARPLVARHRFQPYLLTLAIGTPQADRAFAESFDRAWLPDLEFTAQPMITQLGKISEKKRRPAWHFTQLHMDHLVRDFASQCNLYTKNDKEIWIHNANKILMLSPDNPYAMSLLVEVNWENIQPMLAGWEKDHADFLPLVGALGRRYSELKQYDKARAYLERYIAELPEYWAFQRLADNYRDQDDTEHWLATLDQYLATGEDHGLDQAKVRVEIANHYMKERQWLKAQPYAEAAAETWAGWAMQCAVRCYEGMKEWERAELWAQRLSKRYPNTSMREWFNFCKRTGHGDIEAARDLVERFGGFAAEIRPAAVADRAQAAAGPMEDGLSAWMKGATKEAMDRLRKAYETTSPLQAGCALMALADAQGDKAQRDAILGDLCTKHRAKAPKFIDALELFREPFARGDREGPDPQALDQAVKNVAPKLRGNLEFYVGWLLKNRGKRPEAEAYLKRCIETPSTNDSLKRIAADALQRPATAQ